MEALVLFLTGLATKAPILMTVLFVIGALRAVFKPFFSLLRTYVQYTPNPADDAVLDKAESSAWYKAFVWVLDFTASVKLPK